MNWQFAVLLLAAMVLSLVLSLWQRRRYLDVVNTMARQNAGRPVRLVSGRGKGRLRGAVAVLLIDPAAGEVLEARTMIGATIFARLRPAPGLLGPLANVVDRAEGKHLKKAVESALEMLPGSVPPQAGTESDSPNGRIRIPRTQTSPS